MSNSALFAQLPRLRKRLFGAAGRRARGNAAIETALIAPFLLLMMVGIADYGGATYAEMQVQNAAQAGAQYALENSTNGFTYTVAQAVGTAVTSATTLSGIAATPALTVQCGCSSGNSINNASTTTCPANSTGTSPACTVPSCTGTGCNVTCSSTCFSGAVTAGVFLTVSATGSYTTIVPYPGISNSFSFTRSAVVRLK